jgi:hypothetical protein
MKEGLTMCKLHDVSRAIDDAQTSDGIAKIPKVRSRSNVICAPICPPILTRRILPLVGSGRHIVGPSARRPIATADRTANLSQSRRRAQYGAVTLSGLDRAQRSCALAVDMRFQERAQYD